MKPLPKPNSFSDHIYGVRLYRGDLERLVALISEASLNVQLKDNSFEYETIDELIEKAGVSVSDLSIEASNSDASGRMFLTFHGGRWYINSYGESLVDVARDVVLLLKERQSRIAHLPLFWFFQFGTVLLGASIWVSFAFPMLSAPFLTLGFTIIAAWLALGAYLHLFPGVFLRYKHDAGFLARNKDQILMIIISALIGALIGAAIQWLASSGRP